MKQSVRNKEKPREVILTFGQQFTLGEHLPVLRKGSQRVRAEQDFSLIGLQENLVSEFNKRNSTGKSPTLRLEFESLNPKIRLNQM